MARSSLVFHSDLGPWAVYTCACSCGDSVIVWDDRLPEMLGLPRFYAYHHQPLGCDPVRVCETYTGEYLYSHDFKSEKFEDEKTPVSTHLLENSRDDYDYAERDRLFDLLDDPDYDTKP